MAYDEDLAFRIRGELETLEGLTDKRMFGGLAFLLHGHMVVAASSKGNLMVRVDPERHEALLERPHTATMVMAGRETRGWLRVEEPGYASAEGLREWIDVALDYAKTLPPK